MKNASRRIYVAVGWMLLSIASVSAQNGWDEDFEHRWSFSCAELDLKRKLGC